MKDVRKVWQKKETMGRKSFKKEGLDEELTEVVLRDEELADADTDELFDGLQSMEP